MPEAREPMAAFYGELREEKRKHGGQKLPYKDVLKRHMTKYSLGSECEHRGGRSPASKDVERSSKE